VGGVIVTTILPPLGRFALQIACRAMVESFFKSLKAELVWRHNWQTRREVEIAIFEYINGFYNPRRKHSALGWKSPVAFEKKAA
jgi:putative transposase